MKKILLSLGCLLFFSILTQPASIKAQCVVDSSINSPGLYPDTLRDGCMYRPYFDTIQFAFPPDTVIFGQTLPFDSFEVESVTIPASLDWAQWECDQNQNNCTYYTTPGELTRGCVRIWGCPTRPTAAGDSITVTGKGWFTAFGTPQGVPQSFNFGLDIPDSTTCFDNACTVVAITNGLVHNLNLKVAPNPVDHTSQLSFFLENDAQVRIDVLDLYGRQVQVLHQGAMPWGEGRLSLESLLGNGQGIYLVRFSLNGGQYVKTLKVNILR